MELTVITLTIMAILTGLLLTSYAIPPIIRVAKHKDLLDKPDKVRKMHYRSVPNLGGVAILMGFLISYSIWAGSLIPSYYPFLVVGLLILFSSGMKDDVMALSARVKCLAQAAAASIVVVGGNIRLDHFNGFLGIHDGTPEVLAVLATVFAFVIIINAYNLVDGLDGLAGSLGITSALLFGIWFLLNGFMAEAILAASLIGALGGFLRYNRPPAQIFMGDTGSQIIGLLMAVMAFRLIGLNPQATTLQLTTPTIFAFSLMIVPMFDTFRIIIIRMLCNRSPMAPDMRHLHHCMLKLGYGQRAISLLLVIASLLIAAISYFINPFEVHLYGFLIVALGALIAPAAWLLKRKTYTTNPGKKEITPYPNTLREMFTCCTHGLENGSQNGNGQTARPEKTNYTKLEDVNDCNKD